jgi:acetylornithine aminotransferase/acetylornithine/N-succinyldiaminopimelate aminotransferase
MTTALAQPFDAAAVARRADETELPVYSRMPFVPVRGKGCYLWDARGERYLDFYGGHAVALTGHCHPRVTAAIAEQAGTLLFYSSAVLSQVRVEASELLLRHAPQPGSRVFHCVSGTEANEVALKIARKVTGRRTVVSFEGAFHGRTLASLSAAGMEKYRATAGPVLVPHHVHVPFGDLAALERAVDGDTAAVLCEAIQSLAGVYAAPAEFHRAMAGIARTAGALLIYDEIQTGLGRAGHWFYADGVGVKPDLMTLAKGIASGIPAAAVIVAPRLAAQVKLNDQGTTFGGGPVAMAAMKATLEVIEGEGLVENAGRMGRLLQRELAGVPGIRQVRGEGLLLGLELEIPAAKAQAALLARHVVTGTSSAPNVLRLLPPLTVGDAEVQELLAALTPVLGAG